MNKHLDIDQLLNKLQTKDARQAKMNKTFMGFYGGLILVFVIITGIDVVRTNFNLINFVENILFLTALIIFYFILKRQYKKFNSVNYAVPTITMLKQVIKRYKPISSELIWIIIAFILMNTKFIISQGLTEGSIRKVLLVFIMLLIAIGIGFIWWLYSYKPLHDSAKALIKEIEE